MKWLERLIVLLVSLFLLAMAIGLFAFAVGWEGGALFAWLVSLREAPLDGVAVGVVLLLAALYLLTTLAMEQHEERTIVQETELGQVEISLRAVSNLVQRAARDIHGVRDLTPEVKVEPEGLSIRVIAQVAPGLSIPALASDVQATIRSYLHETVGYPVHQVKVEVRDIRQDSRVKTE
ncbi:MAG: alkaline shock response membrane anchor protein AmaP [Firmicutes bacterium]|nr:alkaline shock response membrane anchor protein AmaP [Bacillota bacterium]